MVEILIIDIHAHLTRDEFKRYSEDELLADMDKYHIDKRVVSTFEGPSIKENNAYIANFVSRNSEKLIGCAVIDPKSDSCLEDTEHALSLSEIQMIEFNSLEHGYFPEQCEQIIDVLKLIEKKNLPVKAFTGMGAMTMPQQWAKYAEMFPNISFIMLHMGCFDYGYGCVDVAERLDNVYVETSNQYEIQILKKAFTNLPKEKILFGSMYPRRLTKNAIDLFDLFHLEGSLLNSIYYKNAETFLNTK